MKQTHLLLAAACVVLSSTAMTAGAAADTDREQRMNAALENYRSGDTAEKNTSPGRFARAEESTKKGVRKAGSAIKHGASKAAHAVGTGVEKTGDAIRRGGEKIQDKTAPAQ
jgi:hypothetical protein